MVEVDGLAGLNHLFIADVFGAVDEVFADGAFKEPGVLENHAKLCVYVFAFHILCWDAIDGDDAVVYFKEAHEEVRDGGFAGTCWAYNGDFLTSLDI